MGFFEEGEGGEFGRQSVAEFFVDAAFFGFDEITAGVEAVDEMVLGGGDAAGFGGGTGTFGGVGLVGLNLSFCGHVDTFAFGHTVAWGMGFG